MRVVRLHPGGLPDTERYTISIVYVNRYLRGRHKAGCACGQHIGYALNRSRGMLFEQAYGRCETARPDEVVRITVVDSSTCAPYAGATVFGSRGVHRYLAKHAPGIESYVDELEALKDGRPL